MTTTNTAPAAPAAPAALVAFLFAALGRVVHTAEIVAPTPGALVAVLDRATGRTYSIGYDPADDDDLFRFGHWITSSLPDGTPAQSHPSRGWDPESAAGHVAQMVRLS